MRFVLRLLIIGLILGVVFLFGMSATGTGLVFSTSQSGNWNHAPVWGGAGVPGGEDIAIINTGHVVTLTYDDNVLDLDLNGTLVTDSFNFTCENLTINDGGTMTGGSGETWYIGNFTLMENGTCTATDYIINVQNILDWDENATFHHSEGQIRMNGMTGHIYPGNQTVYYLNCSGPEGYALDGENKNCYFRIYESIKIDLVLASHWFIWNPPVGYRAYEAHLLFIGNMTITAGRERYETPHQWWWWPADWWDIEYDDDIYHSGGDPQIDWARGYTFILNGRSADTPIMSNFPKNDTSDAGMITNYCYHVGKEMRITVNTTTHMMTDIVLAEEFHNSFSTTYDSLDDRPTFYGNNHSITIGENCGFNDGHYYDLGNVTSAGRVWIDECPTFEARNITAVDDLWFSGSYSHLVVGNLSSDAEIAWFTFSVEERNFGTMYVDSMTAGEDIVLLGGGTVYFTSTAGIVSVGDDLRTWGTTIDHYMNITGVPDWHIDTGTVNDWLLIYVNLSNCFNEASDGQYLTFLGWNYSGNTMVDTIAPIIQATLSEGQEWDRTYFAEFPINITVSDMSYVFDVSYRIYGANGTLKASGITDWTEFGELHQVVWNSTNIDISDWLPGDYNLSITTNDSHNPANTKVAKDRARNMVCEIDDEQIGHSKDTKEAKEKPAKTIRFREYAGSDIFSIEFEALKSDTKHDVKWRIRENNFKLGFRVKLSKDQPWARLTITSNSLTYLPNSTYHGHFLLGPNSSYFFDLEDFHQQGGYIEVVNITTTSATVILTHPDWDKNGGWVYIDPLAGSVNTGELTVNWTLVVAPSIVSPLNNSVVKHQNWANLIVTVTDIPGLTANITFYNATNNTVIGTSTITGSGTVQVNWTGLFWNHQNYRWYASCEILGYNGSSPIYSFSTSSRPTSSSYEPPSPGDPAEPSEPSDQESQSSPALVVMLSGAAIITIFAVWAYLEYFEEGLHK
jgi:hypothetical protein